MYADDGIGKFTNHGNRQYLVAFDGKYRGRPEIIRVLKGSRNVIVRMCFSIIIANGQYFGGGMKIAPMAGLEDGHLTIVRMGDFHLKDFIRYFPRLYKGTHLELDRVWTSRAKKISVRSDYHLLIDLDGENPGYTPLEVEVLPRVLPVYMSDQR